jgi:hypothetical protein
MTHRSHWRVVEGVIGGRPHYLITQSHVNISARPNQGPSYYHLIVVLTAEDWESATQSPASRPAVLHHLPMLPRPLHERQTRVKVAKALRGPF